jgi:hypothetical protein
MAMADEANETTETVTLEDIAAGAVYPISEEQIGENDFVLATAIVGLRNRLDAIPSVSECPGCLFDDMPWHDTFLRLETSAEPWIVMFADGAERLEHLSDLAHFIRLHNWANPEGMATLAEELICFEDREERRTKELMHR